jgi:hypothetical protein
MKIDMKDSSKEIDHQLDSLIIKNKKHRMALLNLIEACDEQLNKKSGYKKKHTKQMIINTEKMQ